jgi:transcriptional regulator with XRE-family HTH domain
MIDLRMLARQAGYSRHQLAERLGVGVTTLDRYLRDNRAPEPVVRLLDVYAGRMPWPGCEQYQLVRGAIYYRENPDGLPLHEIPAYRWRLQQLDALEREISRYRRAPVQYLFDLPTP